MYKDETGKKSDMSHPNPQGQAETPEYLESGIISEELIRWMTEGTSPNSTPRSDCG